MKKITQNEFNDLIKTAEVLEVSSAGTPVVYKTTDDKIIKLFFRRKRGFFRRLEKIGFRKFSHHKHGPILTHTDAKRFITMIKRLEKLGIPTIHALEHYQLDDNKFDVVIYEFLPGQSVREHIHQGDFEILSRALQFTAYLNNKAIYFRAGHLGNIVLMPNDEFGLIDIHNIRFTIDPRRRAKELAFLLAHKKDIHILKKQGFDNLVNEYLQHAKLIPFGRKIFLHSLKHYLKARDPDNH